MRTHNLVLHHIGGSYTAPSTAVRSATPHTGDSFTVMSGLGRAFIIDAWARQQTAGLFQIHSPKMHDDNTGLKMRPTADNPISLFPFPVKQEVAVQEALKLELTGSGTAGDIENVATLLYYQTPGSAGGRFITYAQFIQNVVQSALTLDFAVTAGTAGGYSGSLAFSAAAEDKLQGNTDYAILGYSTSTNVCSVTFKGPDTGNFRIGGPGSATRKDLTASYFLDLARGHNDPFIPVFNSAQKAATYVEVVNDENANSPYVVLYLAKLR